MEKITIEFPKKQFVFYPDLIVIKKKGKVKHEIRIEDIERITYHPKFKISDIFWMTRGQLYSYSYFPKTLAIVLKKTRIITLNISNEDFEKIEKMLLMPIEIV